MQTRIGKLLLQFGVAAVMIAALPYRIFELDRYFVPKELVLHVVALVFALILVIPRRTIKVDVVDALLAFFLVWSAASAVFATNHWLAQRALGLSVSSVLVFWGARRIAGAGAYKELLVAAAFATVVAALTSLIQAYGLDSDYFSRNRAPGGTFGNRNFVAHIAAIGLPALIWCTVTAKRPLGALAGSLGAAAVGATLVLSRSRAAWLSVAVSSIVLVIPLLLSRKYWDRRVVGGRFARVVLAMFIAGAVATVLPNNLNWNSESPYLDSAKGMVNYKEGSGRGRIAQYQNTLKMAKANPVFGVGPGNWPVKYVRYAPGGDPSIADDGMTANPWPSSDWVAFVGERGFVAALALALAFAVLFFTALTSWRHIATGEGVLLRLVMAATIVATTEVSAFDAELLLAAPALIVWTILGASVGARQKGRELTLSPRVWSVASIGTLVIVLASEIRSATQTMAMSSVGQGGKTAGWVRGAKFDPGSYRINLKVAQFYARNGKCSVARPYARRASQLFPSAPAARRVARQCRA
jgi:O-antigen ligase